MRTRGRVVRGTARLCVIVLAAAAVVLIADSHSTQRTSASSASAAAAAARPATIAVRARREQDLDRVAAYASSIGYTVVERIDALTALRVEAPAGVGSVAAAKAFVARPGVLYAEPAVTVRRADVPADPLYAREAPYLQAVHAPEAWDIEQGNPSVIVAVLDTGIDLSHPDLQGRVWTNPREVAGNGADDDDNGCVDDLHGCAFVSDPSQGCSARTGGEMDDDLGHGTFVSGIIAADGGNGQGMVGVARNVTILPVKVLDCTGKGDSIALAEGILYAARTGARVMNISLGGNVDSAIIREAVRIAHDRFGALIVAASGNTGEEGVMYPARYPQVLAVGAAAAGNGDTRASFSTTGPEVDVVAVGEHIIGTVPNWSCGHFLACVSGAPYAAGNGTSFAVPQVTGLVALVLSRTTGLLPDSLLNRVKFAADPVPAGDRLDWAGSGRINMLKSLAPGYRLGTPGIARN